MQIEVVIPGDDPIQMQNSPHLHNLAERTNLKVYDTLPRDMDDQIARVENADCIINSRSVVKWPEEVLRRLPKLKMITTCGIGTDSISVAAAKKLGITVCNVPDRTVWIVAEHTIGLMFAVAKQAYVCTKHLKSGGWNSANNVSLQNKTLGVVGLGPIGSQVTRLAKLFGMEVCAWTFHPNPERERELGCRFVDLETVFSESDVISIHCRLTDESRGLINKDLIDRMKPSAIFINTARGAIVDYTALSDALRAKKIYGAGIDVYEVEPVPSGHPLVNCENVVLTPHNADQTPEAVDALNQGSIANVLNYLDGQPSNVVL